MTPPRLHFLFPFLNRIKLHGRANKINTCQADVKYCEIHIRGRNNVFKCESLFKHGGVLIKGDNNEITIGRGGELRNLRLWIVGNNCRIHLGDSIIFNGGRVVCAGENNYVSIGDRCMFAEGIEIWASDTHPVFKDGKTINPSRPVVIGQHVWLGTNVMVLKGTVIKEGAIVGMGSLVKGLVPSRSMAVGNPAHVVKTDVDWDKSTIDC